MFAYYKTLLPEVAYTGLPYISAINKGSQHLYPH